MSGTKMTVGSRAQVWHGTAKHTSGGLTKTQLMMNKAGRIVSRKKHASAKKDNRLVKAGYKTKKGHFGFVKVGSRKRGRKGHRGGAGYAPLSPAELNAEGYGIAGQGITQGQNGGPGGPLTAALMSGGAIYGSDAIGANLSDVNNESSSTLTGNGIAGAGITDFGAGSIGAQMRAGMAGGRRRKHRGGTTSVMPFGASNPETAALMAGGKKRKMKGGTMMKPTMFSSNPEMLALNRD
jgi:hypothetical protein